MRKVSHKVENGKMVKLGLDIQQKGIEGVEIRGDFFLQPPEKLEELEEKIQSLDVDSTVEDVEKSLKNFNADMIGFSPEDLGKAFRKAVEGDEK